MKKLSVLSGLTLSTLFLASCTALKPLNAKQEPSRDIADLMETVELKTEENTHEMAEADADDQKISIEVGDAEIDRELPDSEEDKIPYERNFLIKKNTKRMQFWVDYFTKKNRDRFQRFINNGEEYRHIIEKVFEEHGLPKELYYVGLIESGYYLGAKSHASAVGPWQFIKGTGTRYGLRITSEIDERQDLFKASKAAAMYFKDLHNVFSSWELALSAYNAGEYGIIRRIMKHGTRDYYELSRNKQLPSETINYVPKVLAAMHVVKNAEKYGFVIPKKQHRLFDLTELKPIQKNVPLSTIARRLNVDVNLLRKLNPELKVNSTPRHLAGTYYLRVPKNKYSYNLPNEIAAPVESAAPAVAIKKPESRKEINRRTAQTTPTSYKVQRGDTLISIAKKHNMSAGKLAHMNGFKTWRTRVRIGQTLTLAKDAEQKVATRSVKPAAKVVNKPIEYKVRPGDNLTHIAKTFDLPLTEIKQVNKLKSGKIFVGQKIVLPNTKKGIYTVRKGDHLTKVAKKFNHPLDAIIKLNNLQKGVIYPGQKLIVNMD
jgi:membrane-bound lytic murein transglycosylase D